MVSRTSTLGPPESGFSIFPAERTKEVHFIRHAEGHHNVATTENGGSTDCLLRAVDDPASGHALYDSRLTPKGIEQCLDLKDHLATRPSGPRSFTALDLVVVSPLTRTCETALHVFGVPRAPANAGMNINIPPPRFLVREECRERWGQNVCDGRRSITEIAKEFPNFDFSEIVHDNDEFYSDDRETDEHCCDRAIKFLEWLNSRPEKCIAVVTHSSFLRHLFGQFGHNLQYEDRSSLRRQARNCELRSIVLCYHGNKRGKEISPSMMPMPIPPDANAPRSKL